MTSADTAFRCYRTDGSHDAFREVVACHLPMVYGTALRLSQGNAAEAEDVSQMVFADLARKSRALREDASVGAWLHRHTCFLMKNALRSEARRRTRETAAAEMHAPHAGSRASSEQWEEIERRLDRCLESLREPDRRILIHRYFEGRALRDVGEALGIGEDAAQKRVSRALDRLRALVTGRRSGLSPASLAVVMTARVRAGVPGSVAGSMARSALQLAGARTGVLAAFGGSAAVTAAWTGVAAAAAVVVWLSWPHWHSKPAGAVAAFSPQEKSLTTRPGVLRNGPAPGAGATRENAETDADAEVSRPPAANSNAAAKPAKPKKELTPEEQNKETGSKVSTMHKWMVAYGLDHGGAFPPDLSALFSGAKYGFPVDQAGDWLGPVIEYRGRKLTLSDDSGLVLMRYRIGESGEKEVRLRVGGRVEVCPVNEPISEDEEPSSVPNDSAVTPHH